MENNVLQCNPSAAAAINSFLADKNNPMTKSFFDVINKYGTVADINAKAESARDLGNLKQRLANMDSPYLADLQWLEEQRDAGTFVSMEEYTERILGPGAAPVASENAVTLEISAMNFFPWLMDEARRAIREREIMPGRYIRVRNMNESLGDKGDMLAFAAAMQIIGASYVETLNTNGTDGSNVNIGSADVLAGYFAGIGMPNDQPLEWLDEYLHHYTTNGVRQVLNIAPGQLLIGYFLNQIGIETEFKVSVWYAGHDSSYGAAYTFMMAKLMENADGRTPLIGLNISNSVNADTIREIAAIRDTFGYRDQVRIEHHLTQTYKSTVRQPYLRRDEIIDIAATVANVAAKHEGADPDIEDKLNHPSDFFDYFRTQEDLESSGDMAIMRQLYLEKHGSVQRTADALTRSGLRFVAAANLHGSKEPALAGTSRTFS
ncbi:hypothetical protein ACIPVK_18785 [Paeniglutamicibacter sp. MACA_103]|uniref:hypothetical protein n=1 Tax=Paeniglutamicibacter sp. MACA_103 TaxID=3377337 RepID=UPI003896821C